MAGEQVTGCESGGADGKSHLQAAPYNDRVPGLPFTIREFRRADFNHLWQIDQECFAPEISYSRLELAVYMRRPGSFTLVAETASNGDEAGRTAATPPSPDIPGSKMLNSDGASSQTPGSDILGFIVARSERGRNGHIITIDVLKGARRAGVGSGLLTAAEERLRSDGCTQVHLETAVDNTAALAFYKRHGFFLAKTVPRYYSNGVDAFILKKDLLPPPARD